MKQTTNRRWSGIDRWLAALVTGALTVASIPVGAQQTSSSSSQTSSSSSKEGGESDSAQGPTPRVFMLPTDSVGGEISELVPQRIGEMLRKQIESDGRLELLPSFRESTDPSSGGSVAAVIAQARKKYTSGIGLLNAGKFEKASEKLQSAVDTLKANIAQLQEFDVLADALAKLARAYFEAGYNFDARKRMTEYAHIRPDAELNPDKYPEQLRRIYEKETRKVEKAGTGKLVVRTSAEKATILIDGEKKGEAPTTISDVGYGYHYLVVKDPRGRTWSKRIQVRGRGNEQTYQAELTGSDSGSTGESDSGSTTSEKTSLPAFYTELRKRLDDGTFEAGDLAPYLEELAKRTEADFIGWVSMFRKEGQYVAVPFAYRDADGRIVRVQKTTFNVQLSNLRVGVNEMSTHLIEALLEMPKDLAVTSVQLIEPDEGDKATSTQAVAQADQTQTSSSGDSTPSTDTGMDTNGTTSTTSPPPSPDPSDDDNDKTWLYVGIGGAVLAVGGLVAGGVAVFGGNQSSSQPSGFSANVSW